MDEYRLGSIFLRNFYVGLDYEFDSLLIGLNKDNKDAEIHGSSPNPFKPPEPKASTGETVGLVLLLVAFFIIVVVLCYIRANKIKNLRAAEALNSEQEDDVLTEDGRSEPVKEKSLAAKIKEIASFNKQGRQ